MQVRVLRGRKSTPVADREATTNLLEHCARTGSRAVRVWTPPRQLAFGRRDVNAPGYDAAAAVAEDRGFPAVERQVGGRAVAYTDTTVAFATVAPIEDIRSGIEERYDAVTEAVQRGLWMLGVPAQRGEPADSFCPGDHALQYNGKVVGVAQRVVQDAALVAGVVLVADREELVGVLDPVYDALDVPFDPGTVTTIEDIGGTDDPDAVVEELESRLVGEDAPVVEELDGEAESR